MPHFSQPPSCLDSAYERESILAGFNIIPSFPENRNWGQPAPVPNKLPEIWKLVIIDMNHRNEFGISKYKTALQPFNGRDALKDAYEEILDAAVYLKQAIYERDNKQ